MNVSDYMTRDVTVVSPNDTLQQAAKIMGQLDCGALPVGENDRLIGMITDRDIAIRAVAEGKDPVQTRVRDVMTREVKYVFEDDLLSDATDLMAELQLRRLPVISREKRLVGILSLGDTLTFDIAGETFTVTIASFRKVKWDSFQPNFFMVFAPGNLERVTGTYLTSVHFDSKQARSLASLARKYPSVSIFDIEDLLERVRSVFDKAVLAVQSVFFFTLFAGLTVMMAAVQASRDERRYESAMLRTLGASRATVLQGVLAEFTTLGLLSGLLAALGASIGGYFVATQVLEMKYGFDERVWLTGTIGGALLVAFSGWLATRSVINHPPVTTLRAGN